MLNVNTKSRIDRRDEFVLAVVAVLIPLVTLPAMLGV